MREDIKTLLFWIWFLPILIGFICGYFTYQYFNDTESKIAKELHYRSFDFKKSPALDEIHKEWESKKIENGEGL